MDRQIISLLVFIFAISVFAETPQRSETTISPPIRNSPWVPLLGSQMAPSQNTTEGPAGRPNLELVPLSTGTLNALTPSMKTGRAEAKSRASADSEIATDISNEATTPMPYKNPIKSNQNPQ